MTRVQMKPNKSNKPARPMRAPQGLAARELAVQLVSDVLLGRQPFDQAWSELAARPAVAALEPRDRALARLIAATVLRRQGELEHVLNAFLAKPLPADKGRLWPILLAGAAQLVCLGMPPHAVVDIAVEMTRRDRGAHRFAKLANAVLRRVGERGAGLLAGSGWRAPEHAGLAVAALDRLLRLRDGATHRRGQPAGGATRLTLKPGTEAEAQAWAEKLGGTLLPTGSVRVTAHGRIEDLPGFADGAWWVQDAAAALVVRLAGDVAGRSVADLCAAPGGKTAQLAAAGAQVTAVDVSAARLCASARQPCPPAPAGRRRRGRRGHLVARPHVRRRDPRCALQRHGHHPPPSRHPAPEARPRTSPAWPSCSSSHAGQRRDTRARRADCSSTPPARSSRRKASGRSQPSWPNGPNSRARRSTPPRSAPIPPGSLRLASCARCRSICSRNAATGGMDGFYAARLRRTG